MNPTVLHLILMCGFIGAFSGLTRLVTGSRPTTSRTVTAYMLSGAVMAASGACFAVEYIDNVYMCLGIAAILGMTGEQSIILLLDLCYKLGIRYIDKIK